MRLNLDMNILRQMTDGVIVLDRYAQIISFNKIAEPWAARCQAMSAALRRLIDEERQGRLVLPIYLDLSYGQKALAPRRADAWLCKNGRTEYAIFLIVMGAAGAAIPVTTSPAKRSNNLLTLMGSEVREELTQLRDLLNAKGGIALAGPEAILKQCHKVEHLMQEVTDLTQLLEHDEVFAGERLSITDIVQNILLVLPPHANQASVVLHESVDALGPVYGNGAWLSYALRMLIGSLLSSAPPRTTIELTTRQMGNFLILAGHVNGFKRSAHDAVATQAHDADAQPSDQHGASIQMMMCRRIIELHAGQLRLAHLPDEGTGVRHGASLESFTLTLMTSVPANERSHTSCVDCRHVRQEIAYAADLAELTSSTPTTLSDRSLQP
jgi:hypothetical protein